MKTIVTPVLRSALVRIRGAVLLARRRFPYSRSPPARRRWCRSTAIAAIAVWWRSVLRETIRRNVKTNGLDCCGHPRDRHEAAGCEIWMPVTRDAAPRCSGCAAPTPPGPGKISRLPAGSLSRILPSYGDLQGPVPRRRSHRRTGSRGGDGAGSAFARLSGFSGLSLAAIAKNSSLKDCLDTRADLVISINNIDTFKL